MLNLRILAIETSSTACSVALLNNEKITSLFEIAPMKHAQLILPMVKQILQQENVELSKLNAIAFGSGPGSFTGVRIATSVAQGLGYAMNLPLIPVSSLAALAMTSYQQLGWKKNVVAIDARIQEVYWGAYQMNPEGLAELIGKESVSSPQSVQAPDSADWCGVGNAWDAYSTQMTFNPLQIASLLLPSAEAILLLAKQAYLSGRAITAAEAVPTYLRDNVAKKSAT
jgi:tRNA threonylcarbamoyladenosine biosynthesis protein TsaB